MVPKVCVLNSIGELKLEWSETFDAHVIRVDALGLTNKEFRVQLLPGNVLEILGERNGTCEGTSRNGYEILGERNDTCCRGTCRPKVPSIQGFSHGSVLRQYKIQGEVVLDNVQLRNNVILIVLRKQNARKVREIPIIFSPI